MNKLVFILITFSTSLFISCNNNSSTSNSSKSSDQLEIEFQEELSSYLERSVWINLNSKDNITTSVVFWDNKELEVKVFSGVDPDDLLIHFKGKWYIKDHNIAGYYYQSPETEIIWTINSEFSEITNNKGIAFSLAKSNKEIDITYADLMNKYKITPNSSSKANKKNEKIDQAQNVLNELLKITGNEFEGSCEIGFTSGVALINTDGHELYVSYIVSEISTEKFVEKGRLENVRLENDGDYFKIIADWNNDDAGDGLFRLELFGSDHPNNIYCAVEGTGWKYFSSIVLSPEDICNFKKHLFRSIMLGNQEWAASDLKKNIYNNGDKILEVTNPEEWIESSKNKSGCFFILENGAYIYNGYVLSDPRGIVSSGFRLPSKADFIQLFKFLGGSINNSTDVVSSIIQYSFLYDYFDQENGLVEKRIEAENSLGFGAEEGGFIYPEGVTNFGTCTYWWTCTSEKTEMPDDDLNLITSDEKIVVDIGYCSNDLGGGVSSYPLDFGFSIRCIRE
jgi:uncharacterized protein (TIGR02145 family)